MRAAINRYLNSKDINRALNFCDKSFESSNRMIKQCQENTSGKAKRTKNIYL